MKNVKRVLLLLQQYPELQLGVYDYARPEHGWELVVFDFWPPEAVLSLIHSWEPTGCIAVVNNPDAVEIATQGEMPFVNVYGGEPVLDLPQVGVDDRAIGRMAADHLADCGPQHLAYFGPDDPDFCAGRLVGFRERLAERDLHIDVFERETAYPSPQLDYAGPDYILDGVYGWLKALPKPVGILACDDGRGEWLTLACRRLGLAVPEQVAILGPENHYLICQRTYPPLSSIRLPLRQVGHEAARLLERLMDGDEPPAEPILLQPEEVVKRRSTDLLAIGDEEVARALRYIRQNACDGILARDVVEQANISRASLMRRFREVVGRTILQEIIRIRLERAKKRLRETNGTLDEIARRTGFKTAPRLGRDFKKRLGLTPGTYRKQFRRG